MARWVCWMAVVVSFFLGGGWVFKKIYISMNR